MAKKRKAPTPDENGILDTGIYRRNTRPAKPLPCGPVVPHFKAQVLKKRPTIHEWLDQHLRFLASILAPHVKPARPRGSWQLLNMGAGWQGYEVADDIDERCRDALDGMDAIHLLQIHLDIKGDLSADGGKMEWVLQQTYNLGRIVERITAVRPFEPLVLAERGRRLKTSIKRREQAALSNQQLKAAFTFIRQRIKAGDTQKGACQQASACLAAGTLPALPSTGIEISGKRLENLYSARNK